MNYVLKNSGEHNIDLKVLQVVSIERARNTLKTYIINNNNFPYISLYTHYTHCFCYENILLLLFRPLKFDPNENGRLRQTESYRVSDCIFGTNSLL